jgi:hypothetical protein
MSIKVHKKASAVLLQAVPYVLVSTYKTRHILAKSSKKEFGAVRVATLHKGNIGDALVK